ncbi:TlpA family protein disulfide reductase [Shewanella sp. WXL01]|uniref:TlpA family protein disulfide reductase n=1 Tax=Shewanella maritima TaxID=2520507 RepID=A0A411PI74_9GAMM|nr:MULTISPECIES: TlpA disulfide reductase family protein [Shewanella]NKF51963.1 TlpA family protein disulfide reductase [Shewanella sp. WXL01]QBF83235.1 TlpA family protein disulfide reductase [Shewanella maritima]
MKLILTAILSLTLMVSVHSHAYPGMKPKEAKQSQSTLDKINVLPTPFPIDLVDFSSLAGEQVDFEAFRGKVVVVNMWATWCPPCVRELPALKRLGIALNKEDYALIPISIDAEGEQIVQPFLQSLEMGDFVSYFDPMQNLRAVFPLETIPATFILNEQGELVAFVRSYVDWDDENAIEFLAQFSSKTKVEDNQDQASDAESQAVKVQAE